LIADQDEKAVPELFAPDLNPYGVTYSEWTVRWWQWCLSQPKSTNPVNDRKRSDRNAANNQIYPDVWFLAGTTGGYAERECTIPHGMAILCPIINFEISTAEDPSLRTDNDLASFARADVDKIAKLNVIIDGMSLPDLKKFRVESKPFDVTLPEDNIWGVKAGPTRAAADGYWLFLKPLQKGSHQIQFGGSCLAGTVNIGTVYYLTVG
jgi:hypothetical protein